MASVATRRKSKKKKRHNRTARLTSQKEKRERPTGSHGATRVARFGIALYVAWVIVVPPQWIGSAWRDVWLVPQRQIHRLVSTMFRGIGFDAPTRHAQAAGFYILTALVVPWIVMAVFRRARPADLGWRRPNRLLSRIVGCGFVFSIPFLYWMVQSAGFRPYYRPYLEAGAVSVVCYYLIVLFCEHSFFEGLMLAAFRNGHRWPAPVALDQSARCGARRTLQWIGLAQPTGDATGLTKFTRWVGLRDGCAAPILLSGLLFGLVHLGKDGREFLLSFPGGVFLAYLAYRCNSWHAPYLLHSSTVLAAGTMMLLMS